jgi:hypothetical protein
MSTNDVESWIGNAMSECCIRCLERSNRIGTIGRGRTRHYRIVVLHAAASTSKVFDTDSHAELEFAGRLNLSDLKETSNPIDVDLNVDVNVEQFGRTGAKVRNRCENEVVRVRWSQECAQILSNE